jgi:hypothetical protein
MRGPRVAVGVALVAVVLGCVVSPARASRTCGPLITDEVGDAQEYFLPGGPNRADLDITAVTVSNDATSLHLTVRVSQLAGPQPTGENYYVFFSVKDVGYLAYSYRGLDATTFRLQSGRAADPSGKVDQTAPIDGQIDQAHGTIRLDVPLAAIGHPKSGARIYDVSSRTGETVGTADGGAGSTIDDTSRGYVYVLDRPACR